MDQKLLYDLQVSKTLDLTEDLKTALVYTHTLSTHTITFTRYSIFTCGMHSSFDLLVFNGNNTVI